MNSECRLIGIGNFSFAHALAEKLTIGENIVATCYDSEQVLRAKYPDAVDFIRSIKELDVKVQYSVDATKLHKIKGLKNYNFNKIVFNFPHGNTIFTDLF